ncbi:MAG: type II toxin-antitoxin system PemK/MazF family toxin [Treponema sp.]|nr:type II toxin-antitoxin system PemK/MazF family toxin [Treponema sp.]
MRINRGEIWSVAWTGLAQKPRPALVIQEEEYRLTDTDILALITTTKNEASTLRLPIKADESNGLQQDSFICLDKLMAIPLANLGKCYGRVSDEVMKEISARLIKILGIG